MADTFSVTSNGLKATLRDLESRLWIAMMGAGEFPKTRLCFSVTSSSMHSRLDQVEMNPLYGVGSPVCTRFVLRCAHDT